MPWVIALSTSSIAPKNTATTAAMPTSANGQDSRRRTSRSTHTTSVATSTSATSTGPTYTTAPPSDYSGYTQRISDSSTPTSTTVDSAPLAHPVRTRYVLVHITQLAQDPDATNGYYGGISEIEVLS